MADHAHVMTISGNGQVSIPAATRGRWQARRVLVVDLGNRIVVQPILDDPVGELRGKYARQGPDTDRARRAERRASARDEASSEP